MSTRETLAETEFLHLYRDVLDDHICLAIGRELYPPTVLDLTRLFGDAPQMSSFKEPGMKHLHALMLDYASRQKTGADMNRIVSLGMIDVRRHNGEHIGFVDAGLWDVNGEGVTSTVRQPNGDITDVVLHRHFSFTTAARIEDLKTAFPSFETVTERSKRIFPRDPT